MHYQTNEFIVESELAAKPLSQTNKVVLEFIANLPNHYRVLDYGCGKLRYAIPLASHVKSVVAIDSQDQVYSRKKIGDRVLAPCDIDIDNLIVTSVDDDRWKKQDYDVVFCTNVLSAIPFEKERFEIIENSKNVLKEKGYLFISVQYRNSYFSKYKSRDDAIPYQDGWLIRRGKSKKCSFYAMLSAEYIMSLCQLAGFREFEVKKKDGSCFIIAWKKQHCMD